MNKTLTIEEVVLNLEQHRMWFLGDTMNVAYKEENTFHVYHLDFDRMLYREYATYDEKKEFKK